MYAKRILERDIKQYIKQEKSGIKYKQIDKIGRKHGFYVV